MKYVRMESKLTINGYELTSNLMDINQKQKKEANELIDIQKKDVMWGTSWLWLD